MKKSFHHISLRKYILIPLFLIILLQTFLYVGIIIFSGTPRRLDENSFHILNNTVSAKGASLEQRFATFVNMDAFYSSVSDTAAANAAAMNLGIADYVHKPENRQTLLRDSVPALLRALRASDTTACFIILENETNDPKKDAIYLRDFNPADTPENNSDIYVEAGPSQLLYDFDFTLDALWTTTLDTENDCLFYQPAFDGGNTYIAIDAVNLGYFSTPARIHADDKPCITYSVPLLDENHQSYGIIGFDITLDYLKKILPNQDIILDEYGSYYIGMTEDYRSITNVFVGNDSYYSALKDGSALTLSLHNEEYNIYDLHSDKLHEATSICAYPLRIYSSRSPYRSQSWLLCGALRSSSLYTSSDSLNLMLLLSVGLSLLFSILGTFVITHFFTKPLRIINKGVSGLSPGYSKMPRTRIVEFDALARAIEKQNISIYMLGNRMAEIIDISNISLGVCEFPQNTGMIYCTHKIFEILEIPDYGWEHNHIPRDALTARLNDLKSRFTQSHENPNIFQYQSVFHNDKWLDIKQTRSEESTLVIISDITENVKEKEKIIHDRDYDILTGLYNRRAFSNEMKYMIDSGNCKNGVLSIWDLDNLKYTNDTYGHDTGDKYICTLSDLLKNELPQKSVCARLSGDEFTMFLYDEPKELLISTLKRMHDQLMQTRLSLPDGRELNMSASAGMAFYSEDASNYAELMKYADFAMYQIKKSSKGSIKAFDKESYVKDYILVQGVGELDRIIMDESIKYAYQPIVSFETGEIFAYEALIRPSSDLLGSPDNLLRVAAAQSKLDKIEHITWFHALKGFFGQLREGDNARIFINSIPNQLLSEEDWAALENLYGKKLSRIVMEITEGAKSEGDKDERKRLFCQKWNIPIALDDYGSGYSNSDMLVSRSFHFVKLDMSLVQGIDKSVSTQSLVRGMINYCHDSYLMVIAEGIETREEYDTIKELGADFAQGYLLAKPSFTLYPDAE